MKRGLGYWLLGLLMVGGGTDQFWVVFVGVDGSRTRVDERSVDQYLGNVVARRVRDDLAAMTTEEFCSKHSVPRAALTSP